MTEANQLNIEAGIRSHETTTKGLFEGFKSVISSAGSALRLLSTINAGGIIALLGFIGAIAGKDKKVFTSIEPFATPITLFGLGLILAAVATCGMYFAQLTFAKSQSNMRFDFQHPYVHATPTSNCWKKFGTFFQVATIILACASMIFFAVGLCFCRSILLTAKL